MEIVFISGWGTTSDIWNRIGDPGFPVRFLQWNDVLSGRVELPTPCVLAGWSLGGQLALDLSKRPEVRGLVLVSSMCCIAWSHSRPGVDPARCKAISSMLRRSRQGYMKSFFDRCGARRDDLPVLLEQSSSFSNEELFQGLDVMFNHVAVPGETVPTVVIHGTDDQIIPSLCSQYISSDSSIFIDNGNHLLPFSHPKEICRAVREHAIRVDS